MARDGAGAYSLPEAPFVYDTVIDEAAVNNNFADIAAALTKSLAKDGQTRPTANLPMNNYRHTGVANGTTRDSYAAVGQVQDGAFTWCGTAGGTANALTLAPSPALTSIPAGLRLMFQVGSSSSTDAVTIAVSGLPAVAGEIDDTALSSSLTLDANKYYSALFDGTALQLSRLSPDLTPAPTPVSPLPPGFIKGFAMSNAGDADHDITISTGECRDAGDTVNIVTSSTLTKQIDANWAEGNNAGGFPSGLTLSANTTYHFFVIAKTDGTVDAGFDTSLTATNLLSDASSYSVRRRVGSVITDGSSNIIGFIVVEGAGTAIDVVFNASQESTNTSSLGTTAASYGVRTPSGIVTRAHFSAAVFKSATAIAVAIYSPQMTSAPNPGVASQRDLWADTDRAAAPFSLLTDTSSNVRAVSTAASTDLDIGTRSFTDFRQS